MTIPDTRAGTTPADTPAHRAAPESPQADWEAFAGRWLSLQCGLTPGATAGLLLIGPADVGPYTPAAIWPSRRLDVTHLAPVAERALRERRCLLDQDAPMGATRLAAPIEAGGALHGAVVIDCRELDPDQAPRALQLLSLGTGRIEAELMHLTADGGAVAVERLALAVDLIAVLGEHPGLESAARAFVTEMAGRLGLDRVSVGFPGRHHIELCAISNTAQFKEKAGLQRILAAAMDECYEQRSTIAYRSETEPSLLVTRAAAALVDANGGGALCAIPLGNPVAPDGVLLLESSDPAALGENVLDVCHAVAALVGPYLAVHRANSRPVHGRITDLLRDWLTRLVGPGHLTLKAGTVFALLFGVFAMVATGEHRVTSDAALEGQVMRATVAPFDGYIRSASVKAGDTVRSGQALCELDDRDLAVEQAKWRAREEQAARELREAESEHDWAKAGVLVAQREQAASELALITDRLSRTRLEAPFDGVVVSGDLSQSLGAPVKQGDVLFEVAPLDSYRVILQVDERDIEFVRAGQTGTLTLSSIPGEELPVSLALITPVAEAEEGINYFRVEARLDRSNPRLRPGMEGVAKVGVGQRRLLWIWTHRFWDWIRLQLWAWWP